MDIVITDSSLRKFLETSATAEELSQNISLCGPTFDRLKKIGGDYIYEIEAITNRVDTASAMGVAREAAIILSQFNIPSKFINDPYQEPYSFPKNLSKQFHLDIKEDLVIRFTAIALENISIKPSGHETQVFLENSGLRALNNCIDITNELTLLYGMPSHIFDRDKLATQSLTVRESHQGESIVTLDNQVHPLLDGDIVIEDGASRLVDLCGVMGGQVAEVDEHTKNILLIVPVYNPKKIRQTSLRLQKRTLAAQLYEKQPDPELCLPVMAQAIRLLQQRAGGIVSSTLFDYYPAIRPPKLISLDFNWLNTFVGVAINKETVISILASLGFGGKIQANRLVCSVPSWRYHDVNLKEDLAEEVARIYGYFRLPPSLPCVNLPVEPTSPLLKTETEIKKYLSAIGYHEIYNNSLISHDLLKKTELVPENHLKLRNTLSQDYEYLRTSLIPSGLENHKHNQGKANTPINTLEIAIVYQKIKGQELPLEVSRLALISGQDYRQTKGQVEALFRKLKTTSISFKPSLNPPAFFNPVNTAGIYSGKHLLGHLGLIKPSILRSIGLQTNPTVLEINLVLLSALINPQYSYQPISDYPLMLEDITVESDKLLGDIMDIIKDSSTLVKQVDFLNSFNNKHTFRISFGCDEKNLEQSAINILKDIIYKRFKV